MSRDAAPVATVTDYDSLIEAFRTIKARVGLSDAMVDELGGLTRGHTEKILGPSQTKGLSRMTFDILLGVFAVKLEMVVDLEAAARMEGRWERRNEQRVRDNAHRVSMKLKERVKPLLFKDMSALAVEARKNKMSPEQRSKIAKKAARTRWRLHRQRERDARREVKSPPLVPVD
ncbi:hypothetical protein [Afipia carboxidovorans]|uniref:hypothetical protein n=1 Tax=Afipia carboxidovorans TaxID=40137 RepID=UPI00308B907A|nr:hypothetical protein CRBSH125_05840 [Afipia carboxidovorans]